MTVSSSTLPKHSSRSGIRFNQVTSPTFPRGSAAKSAPQQIDGVWIAIRTLKEELFLQGGRIAAAARL
jgi:hypothetical protein